MIIPYENKIKPPITPNIFLLSTRSHFHTRYPPPISNSAAKKNTPRVERTVIPSAKPSLLFLDNRKLLALQSLQLPFQ